MYSDIIKANHQFSLDSDLWKSIQQVLACTDSEAQESAKFHCNLLSFYGLCRANDWIMFPYAIWLEKLSKAGLIEIETGWIYASKVDIANLFGFEDKFYHLNYIYNYDNLMNGNEKIKDKGIQIKVYSNSNKENKSGKGYHFMGGYYLDELYLDDSGNRGHRVRARDVVPKNKFLWGLIV